MNIDFEDMSLSFAGSFPFRADGHCDTLTNDGRYGFHIDLDSLDRDMDMQVMAIFIDEENNPERAAELLDDEFFHYRDLLTEEYYDLWIPLKNKESFRRLERDNVGIILALENCAPLGISEDAVFEAYDRGFRSFGVVWNNENCFGGGAYSDAGLSFKGEQLLRNLNRLPVAVDFAHMNEKTFYDALDVITNPPLVTHTCCYDLVPHCRNLKENQMKDLRMAGGVMGITFVDKFLAENPSEASIDKIIDHILYASDFMGIDKIALGSDFDGADMPEGIGGPKDLPALYDRMRQRDFSEEEIRMVAGENLLRYYYRVLSLEER